MRKPRPATVARCFVLEPMTLFLSVTFNDFISKYDGQAATIDNFLETILNNNKVINLEKFKIWYRQNGTPKINFERIWNKDKQNLIIKIIDLNYIFI